MICPKCKSTGTSRLLLKNGITIDIILKPNSKLYSNKGSLIKCCDCKNEYLLLQEYDTNGKIVFKARAIDYYERE